MDEEKKEWHAAVDRLQQIENSDARAKIKDKYINKWRRKSIEWRRINNYSDEDAKLVHEAIDEVLSSGHRDTRVDEYEETMKAMEILEAMDIK